MNETKKTGIFWAVACVTAIVAAAVVWPTRDADSERGNDALIGELLCPEFKDALAASSLKIVTFNETLGEMKNFEVRKDSESGIWTIPSRGGYPADAVEQMKNAANAFVGLKILDVPTDNPEDHSGMGVVEPKLETLDVGDEGVGRLVTFKDKTQKELASIIIGKEVKDQEGQIYVRKPGQDPVYVVSLNDAPLTTKFQDWIEEDLLQLSSIDVQNIEVNDYSTNIALEGVTFVGNYKAELEKDGTDWTLASIKEYTKKNSLTDFKTVEVEPGKTLNAQKLKDLENALDDLKFVDVVRKPEGISANLKADKDFASDRESSAQLISRGFLPVPIGENGEIELLSANGELTATTKGGVQYILRFGNISGTADSSDEEDPEATVGGVNRYLMVSTVVNESMFPVPDLKPIPQTLEDLDAMDQKEAEEAIKNAPPELNTPEMNSPETPSDAEQPSNTEEQPEADAAEKSAEAEEMQEEAAAETSEAVTETSGEDASSEGEQSGDAEPTGEAGETEASGEGESTTIGEGQEPSDDTNADSEAPVADDAEAQTPAAGSTEAPATDQPIAETEEEKLERLAAIQEKITKENERKLEERKENLQEAQLQSKSLNERFADWYYVIPEETYSKLRVERDDLFQSEAAPGMPPFNPAAAPPGLQIPPGFGN
ncbi:DUF4340 domain-containing protein [Stieleria sp. JC731]|uniref:DUF4340 domain-containing protein n=1 Tax=Pirellulaceae TaxID=2691357 RepID=UPI001E3D52E5|nr:DUF4340 domain-containing protein [Stieleria sp. JC731]MCC9602413.1 DUF4340 domain-containing protein [Stieleria sp. JC731]